MLAIVLALAAIGLCCGLDGAAVLNAALPARDRAILDSPDTFILYHINAHPDEDQVKHAPPGTFFHDYLIVGSAVVSNPGDITAMRKAIYASAGRGELFACYDPGYALHAVRGSRFVDLVMCFDCTQMEIFDNVGKSSSTISRDPLPLFQSLGARYQLIPGK
jgi:hypothetical protein